MDLGSLFSELKSISSSGFLKLLERSEELLKSERRGSGGLRVKGGCVELPKERVVVVGDIHGDLESLKALLERVYPLDGYLLFLGDYGDRGEYPVEVYYLILRLKEELPDRVVVMRGNHEGPRDLPFYPWDLPWQFEARFGAGAEEILEEKLGDFDYFEYTLINKIEVDDGDIRVGASGKVPGHVINQFSLDPGWNHDPVLQQHRCSPASQVLRTHLTSCWRSCRHYRLRRFPTVPPGSDTSPSGSQQDLPVLALGMSAHAQVLRLRRVRRCLAV